MQEILTLLASFSLVFGIGAAIAFAIMTVRSQNRKAGMLPVPNAKVRMKTASSLYRCRLISSDRKGWTFTAPMQRDSYVPIPVGQEVTCEVIAQGGMLVFKSTVIARKAIEGFIVIAAPKSAKLENRRDKAERKEIDMAVVVAGKTGAVIDLSPGGAKVKIQGFEREGNQVLIDLPTGESRGATIVDSKNDHMGSVIRLKFDEPIAIIKE